MGKKICLLGTAPSSAQLAPFSNQEWEMWACSPGTIGLPRIDRFFEIHRWEPGQPWFSEGYIRFLREFKGPVYMGSEDAVRQSEIPNARVIDKQYLTNRFGPYLFTSTIAWMIGMAIEEKPEKIALYGVDMGSQEEYKDQRLGCQFFCQIASWCGIEVGVPPESDLLRPAPLYGICEHSHFWIKHTARAREIAAKQREAQEKIDHEMRALAHFNGAMENLDYEVQSWGGNFDTDHCFTTQPIVPEILAEIEPPLSLKVSPPDTSTDSGLENHGDISGEGEPEYQETKLSGEIDPEGGED